MGSGRIFRNPWWLVFGSTLALIVGNGPVIVFTFGVFLKPVTDEFGWNRGTCVSWADRVPGSGGSCSAMGGEADGSMGSSSGYPRLYCCLFVIHSSHIADTFVLPYFPDALWAVRTGGKRASPCIVCQSDIGAV